MASKYAAYVSDGVLINNWKLAKVVLSCLPHA